MNTCECEHVCVCVCEWHTHVHTTTHTQTNTQGFRGLSDRESADSVVRGVLENMHSVTAELFAAYKGEAHSFSPGSNCFEHFGLDFMLDQDLGVCVSVCVCVRVCVCVQLCT